MNGERWARTPAALVFGLLLGVLGMHAMPGLGECHESSAGQVMTAMTVAASPQPHQRVSDGTVTAKPPAPGARTGDVCVSTPPDRHVADVHAVAIAVVPRPAVSLGAEGFPDADGARAPPVHGTALLHRLCVSRT